MKESEQAQAIAEKLQAATAELMKQKFEWSERMSLDCIVQAIKCGDFTRLVQGDKEAYMYIPYQKASELERIVDSQAQKIAELSALFQKAGNGAVDLAMKCAEQAIRLEKVESLYTIARTQVEEQAKEIEMLKAGGLIKPGSARMLLRNLRKT